MYPKNMLKSFKNMLKSLNPNSLQVTMRCGVGCSHRWELLWWHPYWGPSALWVWQTRWRTLWYLAAMAWMIPPLRQDSSYPLHQACRSVCHQETCLCWVMGPVYQQLQWQEMFAPASSRWTQRVWQQQFARPWTSTCPSPTWIWPLSRWALVMKQWITRRVTWLFEFKQSGHSESNHYWTRHTHRMKGSKNMPLTRDVLFAAAYYMSRQVILYINTRLSCTYTHGHPKLFKDVFFPFVLIVIQPLLGAVLLHSLCCNTHGNPAHKHTVILQINTRSSCTRTHSNSAHEQMVILHINTRSYCT